MKAEELIKKYAEENKIDNIGICGAYDFEEIRDDIEKSAEALKGFAEKDTEKRIKPSLTLKNAKSIIVMAKSYGVDYNIVHDGKIRGYISMGAIGEDYHIYMKRLLEGLACILRESCGADCLCFSDTGPLNDRAAAIRSGVGYRGKNGCVIAKNGGAAVFLGYIITDIALKADEISHESCGGCKKCIESCPSGAISEKGFEINKCISYITQLKRELTKEEILTVGLNIYGCDVCQRVCAKTPKAQMVCRDIDICMPEIEVILKMSNKEFKVKFGQTAMGWRGAAVIKRNALCALTSFSGSKKAEELAQSMVQSQNVMLSKTAKEVLEIIREKQAENAED